MQSLTMYSSEMQKLVNPLKLWNELLESLSLPETEKRIIVTENLKQN